MLHYAEAVTFLTPTPALIALGLTLPVLLALYLLKLRRRPMRVGSIMFWPKASDDAQVNVPLRWLRPSWLLALHVLALACLLLALARPVIQAEGSTADRVVLLIDASASMGSVDQGIAQAPGSSGDDNANAIQTQTRLDRAKLRAKQLVRELRSEQRRMMTVVSFAAAPSPASVFTASPSIINAGIDSIVQTDQPANLPAALTLVESLMSEGSAEGAAPAAPPTVILLSDGSYDEEESPLRTSLQLRFERIGPPLTEADEPARSDNVGVVSFASRRDDVDPQLVRVFARLVNNQPVSVDVPVTLALEGQAIARRAVRVPASSPSGLQRGEAQAIFEVGAAPRGVLTLTINRADSLAADNAASLVLPDLYRPSIDVVTGGEFTATEQTQQPASQVGFAWLVTDVLEELGASQATQRSLASFEADQGSADMVIFMGVWPSVLPRMPSLHFGGVPHGSDGTPSAPRITAPGLVRASDQAFVPRPGSIFWERAHPLMVGVPLDNLIVRETAPWIVADQAQTPPAASTLAGVSRPVVLARSDNTPLIALVEAGGVERIVVGFDLLDSNWPLQPGFAVFLANVVDRLTPRARSFVGQAATTSKPALLRASGPGRIWLSGPLPATDELTVREPLPPPQPGQVAGSGDDGVTAQLLSAGVLTRAGIYSVRGGNAGTDRALAVNLASAPETMALAPAQVQLGSRSMDQFEPTRVPRELWRWLLIAAAGLLAVEWIVYGWHVRK